MSDHGKEAAHYKRIVKLIAWSVRPESFRHEFARCACDMCQEIRAARLERPQVPRAVIDPTPLSDETLALLRARLAEDDEAETTLAVAERDRAAALSDREALIKVARAANELRLWEPGRKGYAHAQQQVFEAFAALPEHLKQELNGG